MNVSGTITVNGSIYAESYSAADSMSGSGGSVYITASGLNGNGKISASAGNCQYTGGGGGRIAVILTNGTDFGNVNFTNYGSSLLTISGDEGAAGTIYLKRANQAYGDLIVDNNNTVTIATTRFSENVSGTIFNDVIIRNSGKLNLSAYNFSLGIYPNLTVYGNFNKTSTGNFSMGTNSTLVLAGDATQNTTLYSNESFYNLNITKKGGYVFFQAGGNYNVTGELTVL